MQNAGQSQSLIYQLESVVEPLSLARLFPVAQPLEVELGSGDGSFLRDYAALHPERNFLGIERLLGRLRKLDRKGRRAGLKNLRVIRIESSYLLEFLLPPAQVDALHIYFPDPWPKRKHARHRLIGERFPGLARRVLKSGGVVYLRTDDVPYYEQMQTVFAGAKDFALIPGPGELSSILTDFEREFHARGIPTRSAAYQKIEG